MPYISIDGKKVFYREYGSGDTIVFLNGVMMSTTSWIPFADKVSKNYRMITVDLLDQGKTDSCEDGYNIETQSELLNKFIDKLEIDRIHLIGTSYGGKVALTFALKYQSKVKSLILSNTDSYTTNIMKAIGEGWIWAASTLNGDIFSSIVFPYIYSYRHYEENLDFIEEKKKAISKVLNEEWKNRFVRNLYSALDFNVSHLIKNIKVPTLIISSELDAIALTEYQEFMHREIENSKWAIIERVGHAALYEKPEEYISLIMEFLQEIVNY